MTEIVIDPGHGGTTNVAGSSWNNAVGPTGTLEKTLTLDIGLRAAAVLRERGRQVALTRQSDVNLGLRARAQVAKSAEARAFVSIHFNASEGRNAQGTETLVHTSYSQESARLSLAVQDAVLAATGLRDRNLTYSPSRIKPQGLGVLRPDYHAPITAACLAEISFMDRADEEKRLGTEGYRQACATALADGILHFLGDPVMMAPEFGDGVEIAAAESGTTTEELLGIDAASSASKEREKGERDDSGENSRPGRRPFSAAFLSGIEPDAAVLASAGDWTDRADFEAFILGLNLQHFSPAEFLFMGSGNAAGTCRGQNSFPPRDLWPNITNTARLIDRIRSEMNSPIRITSCYRSPAYNQCVGGGSGSQHLRFNAVDFICQSGTPEIWRRIAARLRNEHPEFQGGIGIYSRFLHVDTRGTNANWSG